MATWVKICGVTRLEDARAAFESEADAIGINFWPQSRRYCEPSRARDIVAGLAPAALVYGVFVGASRGEIAGVVRDVGLTGVQLHGGEAAGDAEGWDLPVIRAVGAVSRGAIERALAEASGSRRSRVLIDNAAGGGSGRTIDAALLDGIDLGDAILAGGLTPRNVAASVARFRPFGVDSAGGIESAPGIKDARKIEAFIREARASKM
ncbi:MAG: N-(5'-phosphoribosyl)anthranilate isomerase [Candidatus Binatia bacterium]